MRYGWVYGIGLSLLVVILLIRIDRKDNFINFKKIFSGCSPVPYSDYILNTYTSTELEIWKNTHWDTLGQDNKNAEIATWDATDCTTQETTITQNNIEMNKRLSIDNTGTSSI